MHGFTSSFNSQTCLNSEVEEDLRSFPAGLMKFLGQTAAAHSLLFYSRPGLTTDIWCWEKKYKSEEEKSKVDMGFDCWYWRNIRIYISLNHNTSFLHDLKLKYKIYCFTSVNEKKKALFKMNYPLHNWLKMYINKCWNREQSFLYINIPFEFPVSNTSKIWTEKRQNQIWKVMCSYKYLMSAFTCDRACIKNLYGWFI